MILVPPPYGDVTSDEVSCVPMCEVAPYDIGRWESLLNAKLHQPTDLHRHTAFEIPPPFMEM